MKIPATKSFCRLMVTLWRWKESFRLNMLSFATRPEPQVGLFTTKLHLTSIFQELKQQMVTLLKVIKVCYLLGNHVTKF